MEGTDETQFVLTKETSFHQHQYVLLDYTYLETFSVQVLSVVESYLGDHPAL